MHGISMFERLNKAILASVFCICLEISDYDLLIWTVGFLRFKAMAVISYNSSGCSYSADLWSAAGCTLALVVTISYTDLDLTFPRDPKT